MDKYPPQFFELSPRTVLRLSGPDRLRYLNGQVTQDVSRATATSAVPACVLDAKGRLEAICHIREEEESYLIDAPLELRDALMARLDRYIIADDVVLQDESDRWHVVHLLPAIEPPATVRGWETDRLGAIGLDLFADHQIDLPEASPGSREDYERLRIRKMVPAWGAELEAGLLPPEAGLDRTAVSYNKGCYLGQEVISRMKRAGKTNQHLVALDVPAGTPAPCGLVHEGTEAGRITSVSPGQQGSTAPALGFRKRKFAEIDCFQLQDSTGAPLPGQAWVRAIETA